MIIFIIEQRFPNIIPIPGIKLGLANIVTVFVVFKYSAKEAAMVVLVRVFLGSLLGGNLMSMLFSLGGRALCVLGMVTLKHFISDRHIWICGIIGAVLHNIGQLAVAMIVMGTFAVFGYLPFLLIGGCIAGAFIGICAQLIISKFTSDNTKL